MKSSFLASMALGVLVGAVGVSLYKPAQNIVKKSAEAVKDEAKVLMNKASKNN